ncbi:hypothetical protein [Sporosarcina sp. FSL K6-3457]|uniref:hypothetical protein n=1 Tax=Sporosarcina sp. FSL K6-3457 TaxID=2978204 RepID=UPI0030FB6E40
MMLSQSSNYKSYQDIFFDFWESFPEFELHMKTYLIEEFVRIYNEDIENKHELYQKWFFFMGAVSRKSQERFDVKSMKIIMNEQSIKYKASLFEHMKVLTLNQILKFTLQFKDIKIHENSHKLFSSQASKLDSEIVIDILNIRNKLAHEVRPDISNAFDTKLIPDSEISFLNSDEDKTLYKVLVACNDWMKVLKKEYAIQNQ